MSAVYLDYQSTTPCDPRVVEAMLPYFTENFANSGSVTHAAGRANAESLEEARESIASFIGAQSRDLIFTSSATEANNLALKGVAHQSQSKRRKILVCQIDHPSVLNPAKTLREEGFEVHFIKVDSYGKLLIDDLKQWIDDQTLLLSVCHGNSEVGTLQDLEQLSSISREHGVFFHVDATQSALTETIDVEQQQIDLLSLSAHKLYGPKGVGVLYRRRKQPRVRLKPIIDGGDQEWGLRAGTINLPGVMGMAKACELIAESRTSEKTHLQTMRDRLRDGLQTIEPGMWVNSGGDSSLVHNLNVGFPGLVAQDLLCAVDSVQCSKGSSCSIDISKPSHVLLGIGLTAEQADQCLRFSVGRMTTEAEIDEVLQVLRTYFQETKPLNQRVVS